MYKVYQILGLSLESVWHFVGTDLCVCPQKTKSVIQKYLQRFTKDWIIRQISFCLACLLLLINGTVIFAQDEELAGGVQYYDEASADGYILFSPRGLTGTYLIDKQGQVIHGWDSKYPPASAVYLLDNGNLLRSGLAGDENGARIIEEFDWDGNIVWSYVLDAPNFTAHHDIQLMPNGNVLVIVRDQVPLMVAIQMGFSVEAWEASPDIDPEMTIDIIKLDSIFEINPATDAIVWEWHVRDHLVQNVNPDLPNYGEIGDFPRRIDINHFDIPDGADTIHWNSITYNAASDLIMVSPRSFSEVWVIDHSLTTEEARGTDGDLLYRWGNPAAHGQGTAEDRILYFQHDARWIDDSQADSNLTVFNNGARKYQIEQSHVIEYALPSEWMTDNTFNPPEIIWQSDVDVFEMNMSGGQKLYNGNVMMSLALNGRFIEITPDNNIVWEYINPIYLQGELEVNNRVFRATFYPADFIGFADKDMQPKGVLKVSIREGRGGRGDG